jgi:hypothetical protein
LQCSCSLRWCRKPVSRELTFPLLHHALLRRSDRRLGTAARPLRSRITTATQDRSAPCSYCFGIYLSFCSRARAKRSSRAANKHQQRSRDIEEANSRSAASSCERTLAKRKARNEEVEHNCHRREPHGFHPGNALCSISTAGSARAGLVGRRHRAAGSSAVFPAPELHP